MKPVRFGIFADLHADIMHDTHKRLSSFLEAARSAEANFIVQLGDFCYPDTRKCVCEDAHMPINIRNALQSPIYCDKMALTAAYSAFPGPSYHVLGNHDCDMCTKAETAAFIGMSYGAYYSFDSGAFHFIVLDGNYYRMGEEYISYGNGNYFDCPYEGGSLPWIPPEEAAWLSDDLARAKYPSVVFMHQSLFHGSGSIRNAEMIMSILESSPKRVLMVINGHEHIDEAKCINGIWYYSLNSMSNYWVDEKYSVMGRCGADTDEKYPNLRYVIPYRDALYAVITLYEDHAEVQGVQSQEIGMDAAALIRAFGPGLYERVSSSVAQRRFPFPKQ